MSTLPTAPLAPHVDADTAADWCTGGPPLDPGRALPQSRVVHPGASVLKGGAVVAGAGFALVALISLGALFDKEPVGPEGRRSLLFFLALPVLMMLGLAVFALTRPRALEVQLEAGRVRKRELWWWRALEHEQPLHAYAGLALHRAEGERARKRLFEPAVQVQNDDTSPLARQSFTRYWIELRHGSDPRASVVLHCQDDGSPPLDALEAWSQRLGRPVLSTGGVRRA